MREAQTGVSVPHRSRVSGPGQSAVHVSENALTVLPVILRRRQPRRGRARRRTPSLKPGQGGGMSTIPTPSRDTTWGSFDRPTLLRRSATKQLRRLLMNLLNRSEVEAELGGLFLQGVNETFAIASLVVVDTRFAVLGFVLEHRVEDEGELVSGCFDGA